MECSLRRTERRLDDGPGHAGAGSVDRPLRMVENPTFFHFKAANPAKMHTPQPAFTSREDALLTAHHERRRVPSFVDVAAESLAANSESNWKSVALLNRVSALGRAFPVYPDRLHSERRGAPASSGRR